MRFGRIFLFIIATPALHVRGEVFCWKCNLVNEFFNYSLDALVPRYEIME